MIAYRVEIWCNAYGCTQKLTFPAHDDFRELAVCERTLLSMSGKVCGWTFDKGDHWCPKCTRTRNTKTDVELAVSRVVGERLTQPSGSGGIGR